MTDHARVLRRWGTGVEWPPLPDYALIEAADHIDALTADLREARATLDAVRSYVDKLERIGWRDISEQSPDIAHGMNRAGAQLRIILGGSRE